MKMDAKRLAELYDTAEGWRFDWQRDPRQGVSGHEAASVLLEALSEISRVAAPYLPGVDAPPALAVEVGRDVLFHAAVALELAADGAADDIARQQCLQAAASWIRQRYIGRP